MTAYGIGIGPPKRQLKIVARNTFVNDQRPRIFRHGQREIPQARTWGSYIPRAVFLQPAGASKIVGFARTAKCRQISRHRQVAIVLHPSGNAQKLVGFKVASDGELVFLFGGDLLRFVLEERQRRHVSIAMLLVCLRSD